MNRSGHNVKARGRSRTTIGDVALAAGVARPTVSAILNNRAYCYASEATRQRVKQAAAKLGYRPSPAARGLLGQCTATLGLIAPGFDVEPSTIKFSGFETAARAVGKVTFLVGTENVPEQEDLAIRGLLDRYVDGIAIYPTETGPHTELRRLIERGFPVVTFDSDGRLDFEHDDVSADIAGEGRLQVEHLLSIGRKRIILLTGRDRCFVNDLKTRGFMEAMAAAGVEPAAHVRIPMPHLGSHKWMTGDLEAIRGVLLEHAGRCDAIATQGDIIGMAVIRIAVELGLRVPEDLAVVGINATSYSGQGAIPLTSVWHDSMKIGQTALKLLTDRLDGKVKPGEYRRVKMPVEIRVRASTVGVKVSAPTHTDQRTDP